MKKILLFGYIFLFSQSCANSSLWGVRDLGNNFAIVEADKDDISIQYCFSGDCNRSGLYVVPSKVVEYNKNSTWLIAKSISNSGTSFWIIDKRFFPDKNSDVAEVLKENIYGPMDSISFFTQLKTMGINLELKK